MAELASFISPGGAVGDTYNGWTIVRVVNSASGDYRWNRRIASRFEDLDGQLPILKLPTHIHDDRYCTEPEVDTLVATGGAGNYLRFEQTSALSSWLINHNFGRNASVAVFTTGGVQILAEIVQLSVNQVEIRFDLPQSGYAVLQ